MLTALLQRYAKIPAQLRRGCFGLTCLALVVVYYFLVHTPQVTEEDELMATYTQLQTQQAEKKAYTDNLTKYEARALALEESLREARNMLPDNASVPEFLAQLSDRAHQSGLSIDGFEPKSERTDEFFAEINFAMKVRGSYHEIVTFIDAVSKLDRIVNIANIKMKQPKTENHKVIVNGEFTLSTYRFIQQAEADKNKENNKSDKDKNAAENKEP